jgi:N-acetyl-anhydromuramyl-L-alanine amidase AmpD
VTIETRASVNCNARPKGEVSCVVIHADADSDIAQSIRWCCDPKSKVSYHTIIGRTGKVYSLVPVAKRAWHAGVSEYHGRQNVNDFSVGLCFGNRNDGKEHYMDAQYEAGANYCAGLIARYPAITLADFTTHAAIARPVGRKTDPGPLFDMTRLLARIATLRLPTIP